MGWQVTLPRLPFAPEGELQNFLVIKFAMAIGFIFVNPSDELQEENAMADKAEDRNFS
jgi:hypothetical protein